MTTEARWVCFGCGSQNIEEEGTMVEMTPLVGAIETGSDGGPVVRDDRTDIEGHFVWDSYQTTGYRCQDCDRSADDLGALVELRFAECQVCGYQPETAAGAALHVHCDKCGALPDDPHDAEAHS